MTSVLIGQRVRRQSRGVRVVLLMTSAAIAAAMALLVVGLVTSTRSSQPVDGNAGARGAQLAYERAVVPLITDGGKIVELGVKVGIGDMEDARPSDSSHHVLAPAVVAAQAASWSADLHALATQLRTIGAPPSLADAHAGFIAALGDYARAAERVRDAASVDAAVRTQLLDEARAAGRNA